MLKQFLPTSLLAVLLVVLTVAACAPATTPPGTSGPAPRTLTIMTHDSFAASEAIIKQFEAANNATVKILKANDAGSALNQAILSKGNPLADVFFGVDNTFLSRALNSGIFEPYPSPLLADIPADLQLDPEFRLLPVDFGFVCLNYDKQWFADKQIPAPQTLEDLVKPAYKGLLVVENPATSSPGLAFLLASIAHFGPDNYLAWWQGLRANDVLVSDGWEDAYYAVQRQQRQRPAPPRRQLCHQPGRRGLFQRRRVDNAAHRQHSARRRQLPPDRIRRHPQGHAQP
ncbi:thiamine ABC transporter substrate-binding protein [Candidatus Amarolinea dominans]|uniref:thiamine ABC transporter substrate-binding protein n=1 Tax=Candidatus Amarolinea dominans TaxID=3140696 RepID=UPI0031CCB9CB